MGAYNNYYPFGMPQPNRNFDSQEYRYGFQGQEKDSELKGEGLSVNYKYRMHDPRVGRFFAVDPLESEYPWNSSYAFSENRLIDSGELEGLERYYAADGNFVGRFGDSEELRVFNFSDVNKTSHAKFLIEFGNATDDPSITKILADKSYQAFSSSVDAAKYFGNKTSSKSFILDKEAGVAISSLTLFNEAGEKTGNAFLLGKIEYGFGSNISLNQVTISEPRFFIKNEDGSYKKDEYGGRILSPEILRAKNVQGGILPGKLHGFAHTHGRDGSYNFSEKKPSPFGGFEGDKYISREHQIFGFLINQGGELKLFNYLTGKVTTEAEDLPGSPDKPIINYDKPLSEQKADDAIDYTEEN